MLRRNLLVIVGNSGLGESPLVAAALGTHLRHRDDVVASHAAWAALRLGRSDLLEVADVAGRDAVRAEVAAHHGSDEDDRP